MAEQKTNALVEAAKLELANVEKDIAEVEAELKELKAERRKYNAIIKNFEA